MGAPMTHQPLVALSEERIRYEIRRAQAAANDHRHDVLQRRWLWIVSMLEFIAGWGLIALAFHVQGDDAGQALFFGGLLVAYLGPVWTWLLARWRGGE
jgi:hypothetical protein